MARGIDTFLQGISAGADPMAQAVGIYSQLKGVDRADQEMALREKENARAERADARAAETAAITNRANLQAIDISGKNQRFAEQDRAKKLEREEAYADYMTLKSGGRLAPDKMLRILRVAEGLPTYGRKLQDDLAKWSESYGKVAEGMQKFAQSPDAMGPSGVKEVFYDPRNPATKEMFEALDRVMGPGRAGKTFTYEGGGVGGGYSAQTLPLSRGGKIVFIKGQDGRPQVTVEFALADPNTGKPLMMNGKQLYAPATKLRSSNPDDRVVLRDIGEVIDIAQTGQQVSQTLAQQLGTLDRETLTKAALQDALRSGSPDAIAEAKMMQRRDAIIDAVDKRMPNAKSTLEKDKLTMARALLVSGGNPEDAVSILKEFMSVPEAEAEHERTMAGRREEWSYSRGTSEIIQGMRDKESREDRALRRDQMQAEVDARSDALLWDRIKANKQFALEREKLAEEKRQFAENLKVAQAKLDIDRATVKTKEHSDRVAALKEVGDAYLAATKSVETAYAELRKVATDPLAKPEDVQDMRKRVQDALSEQLDRRREYRMLMQDIEPKLRGAFEEGDKKGGTLDEKSFLGGAEGYGQPSAGASSASTRAAGSSPAPAPAAPAPTPAPAVAYEPRMGGLAPNSWNLAPNPSGAITSTDPGVWRDRSWSDFGVPAPEEPPPAGLAPGVNIPGPNYRGGAIRFGGR